MQIKEMQENFEKIKQESKENIIEYLHKSLMTNKKQDSKILKLQYEIKYYEKHLKKVKEFITKIMDRKEDQEETWKSK